MAFCFPFPSARHQLPHHSLWLRNTSSSTMGTMNTFFVSLVYKQPLAPRTCVGIEQILHKSSKEGNGRAMLLSAVFGASRLTGRRTLSQPPSPSKHPHSHLLPPHTWCACSMSTWGGYACPTPHHTHIWTRATCMACVTWAATPARPTPARPLQGNFSPR